MLIDGMQGAAGAIHTGGDGGGALEGNLPTQEPLALFSGVVKVGRSTANADVSFDLPAFNGSVRLTAVAWSKDKVGSAQADVIVRDPVVVAATPAALPQCRRPLAKCMSTSTMSRARPATTSSTSTSMGRSPPTRMR